MTRRFATAAALTFIAVTVPVAAQTTPIQINNGTYNQDFNTMGNGANGSTGAYPSGWNAYLVGTTNFVPSPTTHDGGSNAGAVYNFGTLSDSDRALGSIASNTFTAAGFGAVFVNNTGRVLTEADIQIGFRSEQWRTSANPGIVENWAFQFRLGDATLDINQSSSDGWTLFPAFEIAELRNDINANGALNGNATGNFATFAPSFLSAFVWLPGDRLAIRWLDTNDAGTDVGMSIDDFSFFVLDPVPEPAALAMCGFALASLAFLRRRKLAV